MAYQHILRYTIGLSVGCILGMLLSALCVSRHRDNTYQAMGVLPQTSLYPTAPIADIAASKWLRPRARVVGIVDGGHTESDGDYHFRVMDEKAFVVCEITPQQPHPHPRNGMKVEVGGVVRQDLYHGGWWELHPVDYWKESP